MNTVMTAREAKLRYKPNDLDVLREGTFVTCAVTKKPIPLHALRYWNVELQEPYIDAAAAFQRWTQLHADDA